MGPGLRLPGQVQEVAGLWTGAACACQGAKGDHLVVDLGDGFQMGPETCKVHGGGTGGQVAHQLCGEPLVPAGKGGEQAEIVQQIGRHTAAHLPELIRQPLKVRRSAHQAGGRQQAMGQGYDKIIKGQRCKALYQVWHCLGSIIV